MKRSEFYFKEISNLIENKDKFIEYFEEDTLIGYPQSMSGSMFTSEAQFIYALIKTFKPKSILEIGNWIGSTSNHIIKACSSYNGNVSLVDIAENIDYSNFIKYANTERILNDSIAFLETTDKKFDFIVQDGDHSYEYVKKELQLLMKKNDKFICVAHDWFAVSEIFIALESLKNEFKFFKHIKSEESNCGVTVLIYEK